MAHLQHTAKKDHGCASALSAALVLISALRTSSRAFAVTAFVFCLSRNAAGLFLTATCGSAIAAACVVLKTEIQSAWTLATSTAWC
jgi:hypothetical protein